MLLIHGYLATRGSLHLLERHLTERGLIVMSYPLRPDQPGRHPRLGRASSRARSSRSSRRPASRESTSSATRWAGLVGLYYLKRLGGRHRVRRLVMLGTPAQGTWSALLGLVTAPLGLASLQLLPGSPFLRELAETAAAPGRRGRLDRRRARLAGAASSTTVLDGVRHIALPTGHSGLLVDEEVAEVVVDLLRASPDPRIARVAG